MKGQQLRARAGLVGGEDPHLYRLLCDVLAEAGVELSPRPVRNPDVVLATVSGSSIDSLSSLLSSARQLADRAPVIALLPIGDERLAKRCIQLGAQGCWALDTPLALLQSLLSTMVLGTVTTPRQRGPSTPLAETTFTLGRQARALLQVLREQNAAATYPHPNVTQDAESRIERAIRQDLAWQRVNAREVPDSFRLGVHARLEVTLMRLDANAVSLIERAIQADLDA